MLHALGPASIKQVEGIQTNANTAMSQVTTSCAKRICNKLEIDIQTSRYPTDIQDPGNRKNAKVNMDKDAPVKPRLQSPRISTTSPSKNPAFFVNSGPAQSATPGHQLVIRWDPIPNIRQEAGRRPRRPPCL